MMIMCTPYQRNRYDLNARHSAQNPLIAYLTSQMDSCLTSYTGKADNLNGFLEAQWNHK